MFEQKKRKFHGQRGIPQDLPLGLQELQNTLDNKLLTAKHHYPRSKLVSTFKRGFNHPQPQDKPLK